MPPLGTLLLGLALLVVVALIIALPLFDRKRQAVRPPTRREALQAERNDIVRAIRELDFDYRTHKINDEDYKRLRADYVQHGAQVLREINALDEHNTVSGASAGADASAEIERRVAALRASKEIPEADILTCPNCGSSVASGSKFCPQCGHKLDVIAAVAD
jgi:hypothetical protein